MKKVLLSLSMLASVMTASAQNVGSGIYDDFTAVNDIGTASGGIFFFADAVWTQFYPNFQDSTTVAPKHLARRNGSTMAVTINKAAPYTLTGTLQDNNAQYSPFGVNFGDDNGADPNGNPFYIDISKNQKFSVDLKAYKDVKIRVQFQDASNNSIEATAGTGDSWAFDVTPTMTTFTLDISNAVGLKWDDNSTPKCAPCELSTFDYTKVKQILFFVDPGNAGTAPNPTPSTFNGLVTMDNLKLGTAVKVGLDTKSAASKISSSTVFPNPTEGEFTVRLNLNNSSSATILVSDLMGKQVASKTAVNGVDTKFETTGLAKGMYTVTYVIDGTPAKSELVVVK